MGENPLDRFANDTERPAHWVNIAGPVAVGRDPVTVGEFRHFVPGWAREDDPDLPVVGVTWFQARAYGQWLTELTGRRYRLLSEAEWEYACRAGTRTLFSFGESLSLAQANYLYDETGAAVGRNRRTPVGSYPANGFGLRDFHGNVCEWVADRWRPNYEGAPMDGAIWLEGNDCSTDRATTRRVVRGGGWDYLPRLLRSAWRDGRSANEVGDNLGFRVAADIPEAAR